MCPEDELRRMEKRLTMIEHAHGITSTTLAVHVASVEERSKHQSEHNKVVSTKLEDIAGELRQLDRRILMITAISACAGSGAGAMILKFGPVLWKSFSG